MKDDANFDQNDYVHEFWALLIQLLFWILCMYWSVYVIIYSHPAILHVCLILVTFFFLLAALQCQSG